MRSYSIEMCVLTRILFAQLTIHSSPEIGMHVEIRDPDDKIILSKVRIWFHILAMELLFINFFFRFTAVKANSLSPPTLPASMSSVCTGDPHFNDILCTLITFSHLVTYLSQQFYQVVLWHSVEGPPWHPGKAYLTHPYKYSKLWYHARDHADV